MTMNQTPKGYRGTGKQILQKKKKVVLSVKGYDLGTFCNPLSGTTLTLILLLLLKSKIIWCYTGE